MAFFTFSVFVVWIVMVTLFFESAGLALAAAEDGCSIPLTAIPASRTITAIMIPKADLHIVFMSSPLYFVMPTLLFFFDRHFFHPLRLVRLIHSVSRLLHDPVGRFHSLDDLAESRIIPIQMRCVRYHDEELRTG